MRLHVCYGTFGTAERHPCARAHQALTTAGYQPTVVRTGGCYGTDRFWRGRRAIKRLTVTTRFRRSSLTTARSSTARRTSSTGPQPTPTPTPRSSGLLRGRQEPCAPPAGGRSGAGRSHLTPCGPILKQVAADLVGRVLKLLHLCGGKPRANREGARPYRDSASSERQPASRASSMPTTARTASRGEYDGNEMRSEPLSRCGDTSPDRRGPSAASVLSSTGAPSMRLILTVAKMGASPIGRTGGGVSRRVARSRPPSRVARQPRALREGACIPQVPSGRRARLLAQARPSRQPPRGSSAHRRASAPHRPFPRVP